MRNTDGGWRVGSRDVLFESSFRDFLFEPLCFFKIFYSSPSPSFLWRISSCLSYCLKDLVQKGSFERPFRDLKKGSNKKFFIYNIHNYIQKYPYIFFFSQFLSKIIKISAYIYRNNDKIKNNNKKKK